MCLVLITVRFKNPVGNAYSKLRAFCLPKSKTSLAFDGSEEASSEVRIECQPPPNEGEWEGTLVYDFVDKAPFQQDLNCNAYRKNKVIG